MSAFHVLDPDGIRYHPYENELQALISRFLATQVDPRTGRSVITARQIQVISGQKEGPVADALFTLLDGGLPWAWADDSRRLSRITARLAPEYEQRTPEPRSQALTPAQQRWQRLTGFQFSPEPSKPLERDLAVTGNRSRNGYPGAYMEATSQD